MSKLLELQQRAKILHEQHQQNIEAKLKSDMQQIFSDTERTLSEKVQSLSTSIDSTNMSLQQLQSEATAQIINLIAEQQQQIIAKQQQAFSEILKAQQQQSEQLKASLNESNDLNRQTEEQITLKKMLLKSNMALIHSICWIISH